MIRIYDCVVAKDLTIVVLGHNKTEAFRALKGILTANLWPESMAKRENIKRRVSK